VVITVGETNITEEQFKKDIKDLSLEMGIEEKEIGRFVEPLIDRMVDDYLVLEYGRTQGITLSEKEFHAAVAEVKDDFQDGVFANILLKRYIDFDEWKEGLRRQLLIRKIMKTASVGMAPTTFHEIKSYFDSHQKAYQRPQMVKLRQIVVQSREEAARILKRLHEGQDMEQLARELSITPEGKNGGDMGWIPEDQLEESIGRAVSSLSVGKLSAIVKTPYGYHIIKVSDRRPPGIMAFSEAMEEVESEVLVRKRAAFYRSWFKTLKARFPVTINKELVKTMEFG